jgi:hypothetical protein
VDFYDYLQNFAIYSSFLSPLPGGAGSNVPIERIMEILGSKTNVEFFMILLQPINSIKARVCTGPICSKTSSKLTISELAAQSDFQYKQHGCFLKKMQTPSWHSVLLEEQANHFI